MAEPKTPSSKAGAADSGPTVIKKYANRRLYNTASSSYVTLEHLSDMVRAGDDFLVQDAKTGDDITRSVLTQIIFEQESRGQNLLPVQFLRRLIRFYGDQMQAFLPGYLEMSMESFSTAQERLREQLLRGWTGRTPIATFEDQARQNMALFEQAMRMWTPFPPGGAPAPKSETGEAGGGATEGEAIDLLRRQMEAMQRQLDQLTAARKS